MRYLWLFLTGLLFGIGIAISGMINPAKVLNFFDIAGTWDLSLAFVMGGGLLVTVIAYPLIFKRDRPVFDLSFRLPDTKHIDKRLIGGSAIFGIGWGIAGFCPGAALPALGTGKMEVFAFVAAVIVGIGIAKLATRLKII
ncbi:MAG: DUF6691 family protein [Gammaproteobacteria bacterium]|nr:DUF6691 family protein [Gammaproteobacteria bacterium]